MKKSEENYVSRIPVDVAISTISVKVTCCPWGYIYPLVVGSC
ncbi:hypothetical protein PYE51_11920 [Vibrio aestuarianus]|uniref:Uncharacterized protein n=1 Tax=Vibrio aestuarianus TaxID=28171 RepID=A0AAX3U1L6_9VIBR|nr:hypothetical protein [Vibrio aestuarianus]WGK81333.1 hypothetical protein PYE51_11920 [Vibrio aestuarianus]